MIEDAFDQTRRNKVLVQGLRSFSNLARELIRNLTCHSLRSHWFKEPVSPAAAAKNH